MDEEKKTETENKKKTETEEDAKPSEEEGDKPESNKLVDDTNLAAKRLEEATKEAKEERIAREESYAKMKLGGNAEGGRPIEKTEETPKEYKDRVMAGDIENA